MAVIQRIVKPTTRRTKRILKNKEPKIIENIKQTLLIRGRKSSESLTNFMKDVYSLKKPHGLLLSKRHDMLPFEDIVPLETICRKYDASLFVFCSHSKKRANNMVIGRMYDGRILDAFEVGVENYRRLSDFNVLAPSVGVKPSLVFAGEEFETVHTLKRFKNILVDLFHQTDRELIHLNGVEYVILFTVVDDRIVFRTYRILLTSAGDKSPRVEVELMGPFADLVMRRNILASKDLFEKACVKPKAKGKKPKNIIRDSFGSKIGRVHMTPQYVSKLQTRKMKGLKKKKGHVES